MNCNFKLLPIVLTISYVFKIDYFEIQYKLLYKLFYKLKKNNNINFIVFCVL